MTGHLLGAGEKAHFVFVAVDDDHHTAEVGERLHRFRHHMVVVNVEVHTAAVAVGNQAEGDVAARSGVSEEFHLACGDGRIGLGDEVDAERLVGQHACHFARCAAGGRSVEVERGARRDASARVGDAEQLEVVVLVKVVAGNGFIEAQLDVVGHAEDAEGRFGLAEDARRTSVLGTREHRRRLGDEARAVAAEAHGAQVVVLLDGVALAVEVYVVDAAAGNHSLGAAGGGIDGAVVIVGADGHPLVGALRRQLVL